MAIPSFVLARILEETAERLEAGADYQWSHFGKCNCGHVAQTATRLRASEIHRVANRVFSEWSEIPDDFCPQTGVLLDRVIDTLFEIGLTPSDLRALEDLSERTILENLPGGFRHLERNDRKHVILYLRSWADLIKPAVVGLQNQKAIPYVEQEAVLESKALPR